MMKFGLVVAVVGTLAFASSAFAGPGGCFGATTHTAQTSSPVVVMTTPPVTPATKEKEG